MKETIKDKIEELKKWIKEHPWQSGIIVFLTIYVSGLISQAIYCVIHLADIMSGKIDKEKAFTLGIRNLFQWCTSIRGFLCLLLTIITAVLVWIYIINPRTKKITGTYDERNFRIADEGTYGVGRFQKPEDLKDILEFKDIEETKGIILGQVPRDYTDEKGKLSKYAGKIVSIPTAEDFKKKQEEFAKTHKDKDDQIDFMVNNTRNKNILVVGSPGSIKTRSIIQNSILQAMRRGESIIVTDPKGETYKKSCKALEKNGYYVKMFNLVDQEHSDSWNPIKELDENSTFSKIFAKTVVDNASDGTADYWNQNSMNFFKASLSLNRYESLGKLYDFISSSTLSDFDREFAECDREVARRAYNIFAQCTDVVKGQIINGLGILIDVFQDEKIRNITNTNEMDLTRLAKEKTAYFIVTSDQHRTFDFLAVLFWTLAFIKLVEYIDSQMDENGNPTTLPVNMLFDEFCNIGIVPDFTRKLSTVRSRQLNSTIIVQNMTQLMNRYPDGQHEEIFSDCDFVVLLGCNDLTTAKYFSELTDMATIQVSTRNTKYARDEMFLNQDPEYREVESVGQRAVMLPGEIRSIKNTELLVFIRGINSVFKIRKFDYTKNPYSKYMETVRIEDHIPDWKKAKLEEEERRKKAKEEKIRKAQEEKEKAERIIEESKKLQEKKKAQAIQEVEELMEESAPPDLSAFVNSTIPSSVADNTDNKKLDDLKELMEAEETEPNKDKKANTVSEAKEQRKSKSVEKKPLPRSKLTLQTTKIENNE